MFTPFGFPRTHDLHRDVPFSCHAKVRVRLIKVFASVACSSVTVIPGIIVTLKVTTASLIVSPDASVSFTRNTFSLSWVSEE